MKWIPTKRRESQTFINEDQNSSLTITNTGFGESYIVFLEEGEMGVISYGRLTKDEIKEKFNVEVSF